MRVCKSNKVQSLRQDLQEPLSFCLNPLFNTETMSGVVALYEKVQIVFQRAVKILKKKKLVQERKGVALECLSHATMLTNFVCKVFSKLTSVLSSDLIKEKKGSQIE